MRPCSSLPLRSARMNRQRAVAELHVRRHKNRTMGFQDHTSARRRTRHVAAVLLIGSTSSVVGQEPLREVASAAEAVALAETFIVEQGCTDIPSNPDAFRPELFHSDDPRDPIAILAERKGTTSPKAYAYLKDDFTGWFQWWIYFELVGEHDAECPREFRVVHLRQPEPDYGGGLLVVNDLTRGLDPNATLLSEQALVECSSDQNER